MALTYAQLLQQCSDLSEISFSGGSASGSYVFDECLQTAEQRIYDEVNLPVLTTVSSVASTSGTFNVAKPTNPVCYIVRTVRPITTTGYGSYLIQKPTSYIREFWPTSSVSTPLYWSDFNDTNIQVAPTPDATISSFEYLYQWRPSPLSYSNTTTWISVNAPRVLLYATMVEISTYLKQIGDPQGQSGMAVQYEKMYEQALMGLKNNLRQTGGDSFNAGDFN
jgi:hypothetical protein